jgi:hypothetical protein
MTLWIGGTIVAVIAGAVAVAVEREKVARSNYAGARRLVKVTRRTWLGSLWVAVQAVALATIALGLAYLLSTGRR